MRPPSRASGQPRSSARLFGGPNAPQPILLASADPQQALLLLAAASPQDQAGTFAFAADGSDDSLSGPQVADALLAQNANQPAPLAERAPGIPGAATDALQGVTTAQTAPTLFQAVALSDAGFWQAVGKGSNAEGVGYFQDGDLRIVALPGNAVPVLIQRTADEYFADTILRASRTEDLDVAVNAIQYSVSPAGMADYAFGDDPVDPATITPDGLLVRNAAVVGGRNSPSTFYMAYVEGKGYQFGFGNAPRSATFAMGGTGPIIVNGLPYDSTNVYKPGTPADAPVIGEPPAEYQDDLIRRSNRTYAGQEAKPQATGKTIIAYSAQHDKLLIIVQPHGTAGASFDSIRDRLVQRGVNNALFFDGSDSSMLVTRNRINIPQAPAKNKTNTVGIGFRVQTPTPPPPPQPRKN